MKSTRLARAAAAVEWVTMRMVWPMVLISSKTSSKAAEDLESSAPVGSSARRISRRGNDGPCYGYPLFLLTRDFVAVFFASWWMPNSRLTLSTLLIISLTGLRGRTRGREDIVLDRQGIEQVGSLERQILVSRRKLEASLFLMVEVSVPLR